MMFIAVKMMLCALELLLSSKCGHSKQQLKSGKTGMYM